MCLMRPREEGERVSRVPEDGIYTIAHARNALERDEWDIPQYSPDDSSGPEGNNFAVSQVPEREESEWRGLAIIGTGRQ